MAIDYHSQGLTALLLHPGWVKTEMGGPGAQIDIQTSVDQMLAIIRAADQRMSGQFFDRDGSVIPW